MSSVPLCKLISHSFWVSVDADADEQSKIELKKSLMATERLKLSLTFQAFLHMTKPFRRGLPETARGERMHRCDGTNTCMPSGLSCERHFA